MNNNFTVFVSHFQHYYIYDIIIGTNIETKKENESLKNVLIKWVGVHKNT